MMPASPMKQPKKFGYNQLGLNVGKTKESNWPASSFGETFEP
jgi:hypothetical protein